MAIFFTLVGCPYSAASMQLPCRREFTDFPFPTEWEPQFHQFSADAPLKADIRVIQQNPGI
jgi:hypothetical protein